MVVGLEELLLDSVVIDRQVPPYARFGNRRCVIARSSSQASDRGPAPANVENLEPSLDVVGRQSEEEGRCLTSLVSETLFLRHC